MHDSHDWNTIYSDLDDMSGMDDPFMDSDSTQSLVNAQQLNHAKSVFHQLKQQTFKSLGDVKGLNSRDKRTIQIRINDLITKAQISLQNMNHRDQVNGLIHKTKIQLSRIVLVTKFDNFIHMIITEIRQASLTKSQRIAVISEMKANQRYTKQDLMKSQTIASLRNSALSGKNSVNGALVKYVADGRINIGDQLKTVTDKVHHQIEIQPNLNIAAKYLAYQQIDAVKTGLDADLMSTDKFSGLERVKQRGIEQLKSILNDKNKVLANLTQFNRFIIKIRSMIAEISELSSNDKLNLERQIDDYQKAIENQVQQHNQNSDNEFSLREHHLSMMVVDTIFKAYQRKITSQKTKLTSTQRDSVIDKLNETIDEIGSNLEASHLKSSIEDSLIGGLKKLSQVTKQINGVIYRNQVHQFVSDIESKIDDLYNLSTVDKNHLQARIKIMGQHLLQKQADLTVASAKQKLYGSFHKQADYITQSSLHRIFNDLYKQIQTSHLPAEQTHQFLTHLINIRRKKVDYESKQLLIKNVLNRSLVLDKNENLRRMTQLNDDLHSQIDSFDIVSQLDDALQQDLIEFSQRINDADKLSVADREEQQFESLAYRKLCQLYNGTDSPQADALREIIAQSRKLHYLVNVAILDKRLKWRVSEKISKHTNAHLYQILSIHDEGSLKRQTAESVKIIQRELPKIVSDLKKVYVSQTDQLFKKLDYQLNAYSVSWNVLDKTGLVQSRTVNQIKGADNLLLVEYAKQIGVKKVNDLASRVIAKVDRHKTHAIHQIRILNKSLSVRLDRISHYEKQNNYGFLNRVLKLMNQAEYQLNQCLDTEVAKNEDHYVQILGHILRHSYLHEWLLIVKKAHTNIEALSNVPNDSKLKSLQSIQDLKLKIISKLQKCDSSDFESILQTNKDQVRKLIVHSIYLDPVKKRARQNLMKLVANIQGQIKAAFDQKSQKKYLSRLDKLSNDIDDQLQLDNDHKVETVYNSKKSDLMDFQLKLTRRIQLNKFTKYTKRFSKQLDKLKMLAGRELQVSNDHFNRHYHKAVYLIVHSSTLVECKQNEQRGEKAVGQILNKDRTIDTSKQTFYKDLAAKIKLSKQQILSLKSLQEKDKQDSTKLLNQIQKQAYQDIKQSLSRNQMLDAEDKSHKMVKQVIDKVSSASVLVAAIKSANDQVSQSTLDKKQKSATLKQINQIIDSGIHSQFKKNEASHKHQHRHHDHHSHWSQPRHKKMNNVDRKINDFDINDMSQNSQQNKSSILSSIINGIKNFFRWIFVKLANAF